MDKRLGAWNKGRAWIDGAKKEVVQAYAKQSEEDLENFLRYRKEEMVEGGVLFMLMGGRPVSQQPENQLGDSDSRAKHPFTTSMDKAWQDLLDEVIIYFYPLYHILDIYFYKKYKRKIYIQQTGGEMAAYRLPLRGIISIVHHLTNSSRSSNVFEN